MELNKIYINLKCAIINIIDKSINALRSLIYYQRTASNIFLIFILVLLISSCNVNSKRREISNLTSAEIESILSLCHEDTLMVLGNFIDFKPNNQVRQYLGQYNFVAQLLGRPLESSSDIDSMKNIVHELYIRTRGNKNSMIAISPIFSPKIKITETLNQTSLRSLILSDISNENAKSKYKIEQDSIMEWYLSLYRDKDQSKYVSEQTNLAKVFFIQDKNEFINLNSFYYHKIRYDFLKELLQEQERNQEESAQSNWEDYLQ